MTDDAFYTRMDCARCEGNPQNSSEHYNRHFSESHKWKSCCNCTKFLNVQMLDACRVPALAPIHPDKQNGRKRLRLFDSYTGGQ